MEVAKRGCGPCTQVGSGYTLRNQKPVKSSASAQAEIRRGDCAGSTEKTHYPGQVGRIKYPFQQARDTQAGRARSSASLTRG